MQKNFKYLDDMIHSGVKEIVLDSDIVLSYDEKSEYNNGIKLDVDNLIIDGVGHSINAINKTRIFDVCSKVTIKNLTLKNGSARNGGAINVQVDGDVNIVGCQFQDNTGNHDCGAIRSAGKLSVSETLFRGNLTQEGSGGAIGIGADGDVDIACCQFQDNTANYGGGAILSWGKLSVTETLFQGNLTLKFDGGAIAIAGGGVDMAGCQFQDNTAHGSGGAILSWGKLSVTETLFQGNLARDSCGAIAIGSDGDVGIVGCQFQDNTAHGSGGAIFNQGKLSVTETLFNRNTAKSKGGAIMNGSGSFLRVVDCDFKSNNAKVVLCIYNKSDDVKIINSIFSKHIGSDNLILNKNNMEILGCSFESNEGMNCIISSLKESRLIISGGKIICNHVKKSAVYAEAVECSVSNTTFKNNILISSDCQYGVDILNEAKLSIQSLKITDDNAILNKGHIDVRKLSHNEAERIIHNVDDASIDEFNLPSENKFDFTYLNNIIQNGRDDEVIVLNENISLENYELDFYEGGIELDMDNIIIDGDNHFIDGKHKTRIFNITGKNITLKNIIFKNGLAMNLYDEHTAGGGAIRIAKNSDLTLINCEFIDNASQDDGGAILNNGVLQCENNRFINNASEYNGGAIQNNNLMSTMEDFFENNAAKIAGTIYNNHKLTIKKHITLKNNISNLKEDIYNANHIMTEAISLDVEKMIFNTHNINIDENVNEWQTFQYLNSILMDSHPVMDENIKIEFNDIEDGEILIDTVEFDGKDHIIDLNNMNINFKIKNNVTIKNLTLKNALITKDSLFEIEGILRLENVKLLNNKINNDCHLLINHGNVEVIDSHFYNNNSKNNSLINNSNALKITNTDFINNHSNSSGSTINNTLNNKGKVLIENSLFKYNSSKYGGAIINREVSVVEISNSKFIKNSAKIDAGAILSWGKLSVTETLFRGNLTQEGSSGAIGIKSDGDGNIVGCQFQDNMANDGGGAINVHVDGDVNIVSCQFQDNMANDGGGAIFSLGKLSVTETLFMGNLTQEGSGGAIGIGPGGDVDIADCQFQNNTANRNGGAILNWGKLTITETLFNENSTQEVNGGAINNQRSGILNALNVEFHQNTANNNGGAIYAILYENLNLKDCTFKDNRPDDVYEEKD